MIFIGDRRTWHVGPRTFPVTVRYVDEHLVLAVFEDGRPLGVTLVEFERLTADVIPPHEFWLDLRFVREHDLWTIRGGEIHDHPPDEYVGSGPEEGYAARVLVMETMPIRHASAPRRQDGVTSP